MKHKKVLVTGGTGFIGSHLVEKLLEKGRRVKVLALRKPIEPIENENLEIIRNKGAEIIYGDLRDKKSLEFAVEEVECIFHLGAISRPMNIPTQQYYDVNEKGTAHILEVARPKKIKKFIHVSTVSVLGVSPDGHPLKENEFQERTSVYGMSKRKGEELVVEFFKRYKFPAVIIRPCLIYGPRCIVRLIMFKFIQKKLFPLFNGGKALMEFCYVDNLIEALLLAEKTDEALGQVFNITDGQSYKIKKVVNTIAEELGVKPPYINLPYFAGKALGYLTEFGSRLIGVYPPFSSTAVDWMSKSQNVYDCTKAKKILGYSPKITLREGVRRTISWYKQKGLLK